MEVPCPPKGMRDTRVYGRVIRSVNASEALSVSVLHMLQLVTDELTVPCRGCKMCEGMQACTRCTVTCSALQRQRAQQKMLTQAQLEASCPVMINSSF